MNGSSRGVVGSVVAAICAIGLLGAMFLKWYSVTLSGPGGSESGSLTAWQAFSGPDIALAILAALVVIFAVLRVVGARVPALRYGAGPIIAIAGVAALALVVFRLVSAPTFEEAALSALGVEQSASRSVGIFVGLVATVGMAVGGAIAAMPGLLGRSEHGGAADTAPTR